MFIVKFIIKININATFLESHQVFTWIEAGFRQILSRNNKKYRVANKQSLL